MQRHAFYHPWSPFTTKNPPKLKGIYCKASRCFAFIYILLYEKKQDLWRPLTWKTYQSNYYAAQTRIHLEKRYKEKWAVFCTSTQPSQTSTSTSSTGACKAWNTCAPRLNIFWIATIGAKKTSGFGAITAEMTLAPKQEVFLQNSRLQAGSCFLLHLPICSLTVAFASRKAFRQLRDSFQTGTT